ncbi:MAG: AAA family ATPase [Actinomycetota bacterium]|nr:AAA family ATPase [Actinomycetota bacterium]
MSYAELERESKRPKTVRDWAATWNKLTPIADADDATRQALERFCESKRITLDALTALDARMAVRNGTYCLAFGGSNGNGAITALKYRPLSGSSHDSFAEKPSVWVRPIVAGKLDSLDWILCEGETDAARLYELVGDACAIMVLPAGARTFRREWADLIPRGARVALCHDADEDGTPVPRRRPSCSAARRCAFARRSKVATGATGTETATTSSSSSRPNGRRGSSFATLAEFLAHPFPKAEPLLGEPGAILLARGSLLMVYGADGSGKSTWTIDGVAHLAAGREWLGVPVPRPVRVCVIENEGPPSLFQDKLAAKIASWDGADFADNIFAFQGPWGEFSFADAEARAALVEFCDEHDVDVVTANPTLGLGVAASGRPDETQAFVDWLVECGLKAERAFWLLHHENKSGQISGDWGRHPDTKVSLQQDGNKPRTKLDWAKTRWATLTQETSPAKACMLEWIVETQGYSVTELDSVGASNSELEERIVDFLSKNPGATTNAVWTNVKGTNSRIRALLDGDQFDCVEGKRGALLWFLRSSATASVNDAPTQSGANPHE